MSRHHLTATITNKNGRILSKASNSYEKTHPLQYRFACNVGKPDSIYLHAEIHALTKLPKNAKPFKIFVERYKKNGDPGNAKPCKACEKALKAFGIHRIEYTL